jgi:hypothetical protein
LSHTPSRVVDEKRLHHERYKLQVNVGQSDVTQVNHTEHLLAARWQPGERRVQGKGTQPLA